MSKCVNLRLRTKKGIKYQYCIKKRLEVDFDTCKACLDKEYKKSTPIKKVRKNKERVSPETYNKVFTRDKGECSICGNQQTLQLHHIFGRGKGKTDNPDNCIMLCAHCHLDVVHKNMKKWMPILDDLVKARNILNK